MRACGVFLVVINKSLALTVSQAAAAVIISGQKAASGGLSTFLLLSTNFLEIALHHFGRSRQR
jgi:hypothetical protein